MAKIGTFYTKKLVTLSTSYSGDAAAGPQRRIPDDRRVELGCVQVHQAEGGGSPKLAQHGEEDLKLLKMTTGGCIQQWQYVHQKPGNDAADS